MTNVTYKPTEVALNKLVLHAQNVRASKGQGYSDNEIAPLAANIREFGLIQPLLVQELEDGQFGVLAGGRRHAALKALSEEGAKGFGQRSKIRVNVVEKGVDHAIALSLSENILTIPMDALDRYEAFSAMLEAGGDIASVARAFGSEERTVRNSMRLGQIHPEIRSAYRNSDINLDCLKAFASHPDQAVQLEVFKHLREENGLSLWRIRSSFSRQFVRKGGSLGQFVLEEYTRLGGNILVDLIDEDSVLEDNHLVEAALATNLSDQAEAEREKLGFAWSDTAINPEWDAFKDYDRVYPELRDLSADEQNRVEEIKTEMDAISVDFEHAQTDEEEFGLEAKNEALEAELDQLQYAYTSDDLKTAGVIAVWRNEKLSFEAGMVLPSEKQAGETIKDGSPESEHEVPVTQDTKPLYSAKLQSDLKELRSRSVAIALAQNPDLARDYMEFSLVTRMLGDCYYSNLGIEFHCRQPISEPHSPEGARLAIEEVDASIFSTLETEWMALQSDMERFAGFRELASDARNALLAYATSKMLLPASYDASQRSLRSVVDAEALPDIREAWTPDVAFLERLTKPALLKIVQDDLDMADQANAMQGLKKSEIVRAVADVFNSDNITLDENTQNRIAQWAPELMWTAKVQETSASDKTESEVAKVVSDALKGETEMAIAAE